MALEVGPELEKFIDEYVDSFAHWDLMLLLFGQGELTDDSSSLAKEVGRKEEEVRRTLEDLVNKEVIYKKLGGSGYLLNPSYKEVVADFAKALETREKRLMILTKILEKGRAG